MARQFRKRKVKLWLENPYCDYCGIETWLPESGNDRQTKDQNGIDTMATIDHKYSRFDVRRQTAPGEEKKYVIVCNLCNQYKAKLEEDKIGIDELRRRSARFDVKENNKFNWLVKKIKKAD